MKRLTTLIYKEGKDYKMEKNRKKKGTSDRVGVVGNGEVSGGAFGQVIGGGTALVRDKKQVFTASDAKKRSSGYDIVSDPLGSWTGVPVDDPYEKPVQDADDL